MLASTIFFHLTCALHYLKLKEQAVRRKAPGVIFLISPGGKGGQNFSESPFSAENEFFSDHPVLPIRINGVSKILQKIIKGVIAEVPLLERIPIGIGSCKMGGVDFHPSPWTRDPVDLFHGFKNTV